MNLQVRVWAAFGVWTDERTAAELSSVLDLLYETTEVDRRTAEILRNKP